MCRIFSAHTRENTALRCSNDRSVKFHDTSHATKHGFKGEIEKAHENIMTLTLESLTMPAATDGPTHIIKEKSRTSQCRIKQKNNVCFRGQYVQLNFSYYEQKNDLLNLCPIGEKEVQRILKEDSAGQNYYGSGCGSGSCTYFVSGKSISGSVSIA